MNIPKLLTIDEVADVLRITRPAAYMRILRGQIPAVHIGATVRVRENDLLDLLESTDRVSQQPDEARAVDQRDGVCTGSET